MGKKVQEGWSKAAKKYGIDVDIDGLYTLGHFAFKYEEALTLKTLFTKLMLEKGFLATTAFYASYAQKENDVNRYLQAVDEVFSLLADYINEGDVKTHLETPVCHSGFSRLT